MTTDNIAATPVIATPVIATPVIATPVIPTPAAAVAVPEIKVTAKAVKKTIVVPTIAEIEKEVDAFEAKVEKFIVDKEAEAIVGAANIAASGTQSFLVSHRKAIGVGLAIFVVIVLLKVL